MSSDNSKITILIAEDSPTQAEQLKSILEKNNYTVIYAKDGKEALRLISENKPSLIISDIIMPEMDGYQLCKEVKSNESTKDIPVILLTSLHNSEDVLEGIACGADNFLTKPYSEAYLISHIEQISANKKIYKNERIRTGVEILFEGKWRFITSDQQQILTLLLSTYDAAVAKNKELMQTQEKLELLNEHLEELVEERTAELQQANHVKDKFLSIIAHDIRSPFMGFLHLTEIMTNEKAELDKSQLIDYSKKLHTSALNQYQLLENIFQWSQMQGGSIDFTPREIGISDLILNNILLIHQRAVQKGITIINEVQGTHTAYADPRMIDAVLRNLLSNAVKFSNRGEKVVIKLKETEKEMIEISVIDTGIGIPGDIIKKLFVIGEKVGSKGTEGELSTGLGLILCKEFVERNGGKIWVESKEKQGSIFSFTIPMNTPTKKI